MLLQSVLTKLAAAGLATKAAAGGTAVVLAASAAGASGTLPGPAQEAFDDLVTTESADVADVEDEGADVEGAEFGARVSQDATGESDGEPGVDGAEIACEASEGRSGTCADDLEDEGVDEDEVEGAEFGERVSQDATGESDGEPGVDGEEISTEARELGGADEADTDDADVDEDDEDGGPEGTPGQAAVDANRPSDEG